MSAFHDWAMRAATTRRAHEWSRPLRMATDCSGLGTPELAMRSLLQCDVRGVPGVDVIWACDIDAACRKWLAQHVKPQHLLADMCERVFVPHGFVSRDIDGTAIFMRRAEADLDLYVVGFMCTPFSTKGPRLGFDAPAAKTFTNAVRTINAVRPRAVVMENVVGILQKDCIERVEALLKKIPGYYYSRRVLNSCDFGLPQHRRRVYITLLRKDSVEDPRRAVKELHHEDCNRLMRPCKTNFRDWLADRGVPICPAAASAGSTESSEGSTYCGRCGVNRVCPVHPCRCQQCKAHGVNKKLCKWRVALRTFLQRPAVKLQRSKFLKQWRSIKKDKALKNPPTYFQLAALKTLRVCVGSPRERHASGANRNSTSQGWQSSCSRLWCQQSLAASRLARRCVLDVLGSTVNLFDKCAILDLSQNIGRVALRKDGRTPTLTSTCGHLFVPSLGTKLTPQQVLALQGINVTTADISRFSAAEVFKMAGNAMSVPVVGAVVWCVVCELRGV